MTLNQLYNELLPLESITYSRIDQDSPPQPIQSRTENLYPDLCWEMCHSVSRQPGLSPEYTSFIFRLKNDLLTTRERLHRVGKAPNSLCLHCGMEEGHTHILSCSYNR